MDRKFFDLCKQMYPQIGPDLYWILGMGLKTRHATEVRPGTLPAGDWIPTLCELWIRLPCGTPYEQVPRSKGVTEQCSECQEIAVASESSAVVWDF